MKLCLDLQGAQTESRYRGIGRYTSGLARAIAAKAGAHEVHVVLNGALPDTIEPMRALLGAWVAPRDFHVFGTPGPVAEMNAANAWRARAAEPIREAFVADLAPDVVHVSSMFEGWLDDAVTSIGAFDASTPSACTLYDLIPLLHPEEHLADAAYRAYYMRKLESMRRARMLFAISRSARAEAIDALRIEADRVVEVGCGVDTAFRPQRDDADRQALERHRLTAGEFVFYVGGFDARKNVQRLIEAYSRQPPGIRARFPLVVGGKASTADRDAAMATAMRSGLPADRLRFIGGLDDADLAAIYRAAALFVFPSLHEGFGLPAAEAMACGTAVVAADSPGLRDVVGRPDALFDPLDVDDIARVVTQALADATLREALREHGLAAARRFTWERCAEAALAALEAMHEESRATRRASIVVAERPRLAFVSPLPPERTGVADYCAGLLPALAQHYAIDVVVDQPAVRDPWIEANLPVHQLDWLEANASSFERIVYHVGNSPFHRRMIEVAQRHPGIVVLHDFFLTNLARWQAEHGGRPGALAEALYLSHGYAALRDEALNGRDRACVTYPACLEVLESAATTLVHSRHAIDLARHWFGASVTRAMAVVPMHVEPVRDTDRSEARRALGIADDAFLVVSFGFVAPTKLHDRLLEAWGKSGLAADPRALLRFVGENEGGAYGRGIASAIASVPARERIRVTGFVPSEAFDRYLVAADCAVQLRAGSRGESSWAVLRCLANGLPTIANAHGSAAEIPADVAYVLPDTFDDADLAHALRELRDSPATRARLSDRAKAYAAQEHAPQAVASHYADAIEHAVAHAPLLREGRAIRSIAALSGDPVADRDRVGTAVALASQRPRLGPRQWLIDVSVVARKDLRTGIERVVRGVLVELLRNPPPGTRVEPVRDDGTGIYRYARDYAARTLSLTQAPLPDEIVEVAPGDAFLGLDWYADGIPRLADTLADWRDRGVDLHFVVYDLLPVLLPGAFPPTSRPIVEQWLQTIAALGDGLACISEAVERELAAWLQSAQVPRARPLALGHFPLGATFADSRPTSSPTTRTDRRLAPALARPAILVVGTVEPRKAHDQIVAAFDLLWRDGVDANLVIVGKQGWMMESLAKCLRAHPERGKRLWWFEELPDDALERLYRDATGLVIASRGEGFGLPIVEAARHGLPVLARDLPVFREVARGQRHLLRRRRALGPVRRAAAMDGRDRRPQRARLATHRRHRLGRERTRARRRSERRALVAAVDAPPPRRALLNGPAGWRNDQRARRNSSSVHEPDRSPARIVVGPHEVGACIAVEVARVDDAPAPVAADDRRG